jgi:hypothetical protein
MIQLLIDIGILIEVDYREIAYLDLILKPFPKPEDLLIITPEESDQALENVPRYRFSQGG